MVEQVYLNQTQELLFLIMQTNNNLSSKILSSKRGVIYYSFFYYILVLPLTILMIGFGLYIIYNLVLTSSYSHNIKLLTDHIIGLTVGLLQVFVLTKIKMNLVDEVLVTNGAELHVNKKLFLLKDVKFVREIILLHNSYCWFGIGGKSYFFSPRSSETFRPLAFHFDEKDIKNPNIKYFIERIKNTRNEKEN